MRTVRNSVFETNSSSTHSLSILPKREFEELKKNNLFFDEWGKLGDKKYYTEEEAYSIAKKKILEDEWDGYRVTYNISKESDISEDVILEYLRDLGVKRYNDLGGDYFKTYEIEYKTENGDEIVVFGYYGQDG